MGNTAHVGTGPQTAPQLKGLWSSMIAAAREHGPEHAVAQMRAAAPLPDDSNRLFDTALIGVGRERLAVADEVLSRGLTYSLPNWLGVPELYWEQGTDVGNVRVVMDPSSRMDGSLPAREGVTMPIPAIISDFQLSTRTQLASERAGAPVDLTLFENAARRVNEQIEDLFINGWAAVGGNQFYGLLNAPNASTVSWSGSNPAWDHASKTGAEILTDVLAMADQLKADNFFGPYTLFIETNYENALNKLFDDGTTTQPFTRREVLERLRFGGQNLKIVVADQLPDDRAAMVQMTSNVIQAVVGQQPTQVSWSDGPGWNSNFAVVACVLPRIRNTYDDTSGVCTGNV